MDDRQWLQTWQAVCQKEAEMKICQQQSFDKFRVLEMKMRLMDLRIDTAFNIRDEYLNKLLTKYPNWKPQFVSVGLPKKNFDQFTNNKTELAISQLVDMDMLQNWDEKITLEHLVQSKFKNNNQTFLNSPIVQDSSLKDIKVELEQVKKQLNDISVYLRDLKTVQIQEQPKTTVSISRRQSMRDREYSAIEHIRLPKATDSAAAFVEAEKEEDFDYEEPKPAIPPVSRPAVVQRVPEPQRPVMQPSVQPAAPGPAAVPTGPRFNFGPPKEPQATIVEPAKPVATIISPPAKEPQAVVIEQKPEPKVTQKIPASSSAEVQKAEQKKQLKPEPKKSESFFTDPIKDDIHSNSTPESTPEIAKSTKVVQSYEALLGIVKDKTSETIKNDSDSESSSDDIEKRMMSPPPVSQSKASLMIDNALGKKTESQAQMSTTTARQNSSNFLLETFSKPDDKKPTTPSKAPSSALLSAAPKDTKPSPSKPSAAQKQEPLSDPDDFLAKLFPDKFANAKKADDKPKGGPVASLFGERKPNKSAFFIGDDSDSETVDIPKKKQQSDDDFDFFS